MAKLRCVFYDPDAVDAGSHLSERAFEACARAEIAVFELQGEDAVELEGELQGIAFVMRALDLDAEQCIGVGAALARRPGGRGVGEPAGPGGPRAHHPHRRGGRRAALRGRDQRVGPAPMSDSANSSSSSVKN